MVFLYKIAHSPMAALKAAPFIAQLSEEGIRREFELVDNSFNFYFGEVARVRAHNQVIPNGEGVWIWVDDQGSQQEADALVEAFLRGWNDITPGLATFIESRSQLFSRDDDATGVWQPSA